ncbi:Mpo1-like protein, partial [Streptomyces sp. NPDC056730]
MAQRTDERRTAERQTNERQPAEPRTFDSYEEFWPYYVAMHSKAATRWLHLTGTLTGLAVSAYGLARGRKRYMAALPLIGYG